jgi:phospholipase/carboxylesterase
VPLALGRGTRDGLEQAGYEVDYHEYPMAHSVCYNEVRDIGDWLADLLN